MAYGNTIARNHLSQLAMSGRGGDTELAHVNPQEKNMLELMGGSGGINPNTGLREYQDDKGGGLGSIFSNPLFTGLQFGISSMQAWTQGRAQRQQYESQEKAAKQGLADIGKAREQLGVSLERQQDVARQQYGMGIEKLSAETGAQVGEMRAQSLEAVRKSGLATSGTIAGKRAQSVGKITGGFSRGQETLHAGLGEKMGALTEWFEGEQSRLKSEESRLGREKDLAHKRSKDWYLGKNIFG